MQERYWRQLTQFKFEMFYYSIFYKTYIRRNRNIQIAVTIFSSTAISVWACYEKLSFLCALIISVGYIVNTVNFILPYQNRIKDLIELQPQLTALYIEYEKQWYNVANSLLSENDINDLCYEQLQNWEHVKEQYFKEDALPENNDIYLLSEKEKNEYFKKRFGV